MPADAVGEVVVAGLEAVGEVVLTEQPKRGRRRLVYWAFVILIVGLIAFGAYLALG